MKEDDTIRLFKGNSMEVEGSVSTKDVINAVEKEGYGIMRYNDGKVYIGNWENDKMKG